MGRKNRLSFSSITGSPHGLREQPDGDLTTAHILVVDDRVPGCALIAAQLQGDGFQNIELVESGSEALQAIRSRRPELVIADLLMTEMNGFDLCRAVRSNAETRAIPILAQTSSANPDLRALAFASGATDLFTRPYEPNELFCRVRILLERGRLVDRLTEFRQMIAEDLRQAAATQEALLPNQSQLDYLKTVCPLDLASLYEASEGLGGDIWGIDHLRDQRVLIFNADFAGHGVSAALNTVRLHSFIHSALGMPASPAAMLDKLNQFLCNVLPTGQYATMFCAIMDFGSSTLEYASAASPPQLLRNAAGRPFVIIEEPGFPLGVSRDAAFDNRVAAFEPGAMLILFSDALIETPAPPDSVFTADGLCAFVNDIPPDGDPHELCDGVLRHLFSRISDKPADDLTLIAAHHLPPER